MFKSTSTHMIVLGVLAIIVGIVALLWPGISILALVILFALYYGISQIKAAVQLRSTGREVQAILQRQGVSGR